MNLLPIILTISPFLNCASKKVFQYGPDFAITKNVDYVYGHWTTVSAADWENFARTSVCNIERVSLSDFSDKFSSIIHKRPLLINFDEAHSWIDKTFWLNKSMLTDFGDFHFHIGGSSDVVKTGGNPDSTITVKDYIQKYQGKPRNFDNELLYVFDRKWFYHTALERSLNLPAVFKTRSSKESLFFFMGGSGTGTAFHKHADGWNGVVFGRKRWFLYPSSHTPVGGSFPSFSILEWYKNVYPTLPEDKMPHECTQEAGEILYLPEGWYHGTINIGHTVAVGGQNVRAVTVTEGLFYEIQDEAKLFYELRRIILETMQSNGRNTFLEDGTLLAMGEQALRQHDFVSTIWSQLNNILPESTEVKFRWSVHLRDWLSLSLDIIERNGAVESSALFEETIDLFSFNVSIFNQAESLLLDATATDNLFGLAYLDLARLYEAQYRFLKLGIHFEMESELEKWSFLEISARAITAFERAFQIMDYQPYVANSLAQFYYIIGEKKRGRNAYEISLEKHPYDKNLLIVLRNLYLKDGDSAKASVMGNRLQQLEVLDKFAGRPT